MTYEVTNPPRLVRQTTSGPSVWIYSSADPHGTVDNTDYFSDGARLGMKDGDSCEVYDTANQIEQP